MTAIKNGTLLVKDSNGNTARVATLSQTDITTLNTALADIDANKKRISSISANYVTTNTAQDISTKKFFVGDDDNNINLCAKDLDRNDDTNAGYVQGKSLFFLDKNKKEIGSVYSSRFGTGDDFSIATRLQACNPKSTLVNNPYLEIKSTKKGWYSYAPSCMTHSGVHEIATVDWVRSYIMPAGVIIPFAGSSIPTGYLLCNGAVVSRTTYANLFKVIGTTYGAGDGSTTFKLPDLRDRFLEGAGTNAIGRYLSAGLPNITGTTKGDSFRGQFPFYWLSDGAFSTRLETLSNDKIIAAYDSTVGYNKMSVIAFDASKANAIYNASLTVQPNAVTVQYLIKY